MKKVGVLTIHNAYNYGAVLQAYATQKAFENIGINCEIIDYYTQFEEERKKFLLWPDSSKNIKQDIRNILHPCIFSRRKKQFKKFIEENLALSKEKFNKTNINKVADCGYDCLATGSDQTFNLNLNSSKDDLLPYFLPFDFEGKKISYASSMGDKMRLITEEQREWMKNRLLDYNSISVREPVAADYIENLTGKRSSVIYDPTLVLSKDEWDKVCDDSLINEKYILFYTVLSSPWVVKYVKNVSKQTGLKVIAVHPQNSYEVKSGFIRRSDCGPSQFINLIKNAELVITSSFHGTVFSMIYEKSFYTTLLGEGNRINNLLSKANLQNRLIFEDNQTAEVTFDNGDVIKAGAFLNEARKTNSEYIKSIFA